ncbi:MAG TPA: alpha-2-macroglobulin family protein, partial [Pirellulaceae bacterium]|nr:alpha-2-macroglobulin family protein [Pirellulaceae bacterium]
LGEKITAKIKAKYYFGSPVSKAKIKYRIMRSDYAAEWFPVADWDWCYGKGYWWFAYDAPWYPGFNEWCGCRRPMPPWFPRGNHNPPELVAEQELDIAADGTLDVTIDTEVAKALHPNQDHEYTITAEVRDESRRTIVGTGKVLVARKPFKVYSWVNRGYYRVGDTIDANFLAQTLDQKPVEGKGELTLFKITYDKDRQPIETPVRRWDVATGVEGRAEQQMKASAKGQYRLSLKLTDKKEHSIEGGYLFTIIGDGFDGQDYRFNNVELIPEKREYQPGETVKLQINTNRNDSTVLLFIRPTNGIYLPPKVLHLKGKTTVEEIGVVKKDMPNFFVEALTISDGQVYTETKEVVVPPEKRVLNVAIEPSATEYKPGEKAKVKVHLTDFSGENFVGSSVVSIYDKSVEYISGGSNVADIKDFFWKWRRHHNPSGQNSLAIYSYNMTLKDKPGMAFLGAFGATLADELDAVESEGTVEKGAAFGGGGGRGGLGGALRKSEMLADGAMPAALPMMARAAGMAEGRELQADAKMSADKQQNGAADRRSAGPGQGGDDQGGAALVEPTVRSNFADTALWVGAITTDKTGMAEVDLTMPENLTTWKVKVWSIGNGARVGSADAELVTRKNLIIRLQAPRFFVQKDEVVLSANVHNYLKTDKEVTVSLDLPEKDLLGLIHGEQTQKVTIKAGGEQRVDWRVKVAKEGQATIRMKALTDEESDATEMKLPCYVHGLLKTESWAGTIRPDKDSAKVTVNVPAERRIEQSVLEIRYSPTLAAAMVDALPYLAEYPYGCTEQTLNRFLPTVITQKTLLNMKLNLAEIRDKRTNLNAQEIGDDKARAKQWKRFDRNPVFDEEELNRMVKENVTMLTNMQLTDGGWGWFSGMGERSWPHTTAVVVHGLQLAKENDVALVPNMLERGVDWLKRYQAEEVQKIKNADGKVQPWKTTADNLDAFVYMVLVDAGQENKEMRDFLYRDRTHLAVYAKALFGLGLHKVGDAEKLAMIMQNIDQFLVQDSENETAYLKLPENNYWWYWYGSETEANAYYLKLLARLEPKGEKAPRLVKYLL